MRVCTGSVSEKKQTNYMIVSRARARTQRRQAGENVGEAWQMWHLAQMV